VFRRHFATPLEPGRCYPFCFNLELGLNAFQFRFSVDYGPLMAGSVLSVLPMVIAFLLLRRQIIDSAAMSGLKG
jgi:multiple sugar transport system permease protein